MLELDRTEILMSKKLAFVAALACPVTILAAPVAAQDIKRPPARDLPQGPPALIIPPPAPPASRAPVAEAAPEHFDLFAAIIESTDENVIIDQALVAMEQAFMSLPTFQEFERESPGTTDEIVAGMRPILLDHSKSVREQYAPRIALLFAQHLSPEEALSVAEFYRSPLGNRLMKTASQQSSFDNVMTDFDADRDVTSEEMNRDLQATTEATIELMSPEDIAEIERQFSEGPAFLKFRIMMPRMQRLMLDMENEPLSAQAETRVNRLVSEVLDRRIGGR